MASREEMSTSFGRVAAVYEAGRPEYPAEAVEWMLAPVASRAHPVRVADVGAGTGKLTRALREAGAEAVAIDPDAGMLDQLRSAVPGVPTFVGTGERLPLPDGAVDAVVFGQAWHWVDPAAASVECGRVLRPGGVLGLVWNVRDESVEWVAELTRIMKPSSAEQFVRRFAADGSNAEIRDPFGPPDAAEWAWVRPMTRDALLAMVRSRSYVITAAPDERARIEAGIAALFDEIGAVGDAVVDMPYRTTARRARKER